jgi:hypothetical protein
LRGDETGLVGVDDDLDPVAQAELGHDVADVGLDRGLGDGTRMVMPRRQSSRPWREAAAGR